MNSTSALACAATLSCLTCCGQTNSRTARTIPFFLPPVQLRLELRADAVKLEPTISTESSSAAKAQRITLDSILTETDLQSRVVRSGEFYLTRPEPKSNDPVVRFVDGIFSPEVVHIGKLPVTSSVVTAIKRKNPLCLLNPIIFQLSW